MKKSFLILMLFNILAIGFFAQSTLAQGLLGKRYIVLQVGQQIPGDEFIKDIDDNIFLIGGGINIPVGSNVDASISVSHARLDGEYWGIDMEATNTGVLGGVNYHFTPEQQVNPFIGLQVGAVFSEAEVSYRDLYYSYNSSEDDTDFAIGAGVGVEIALGDLVSLRPSIAYTSVGDADDVVGDLGLNIWFSETVFGNVSISYLFDAEDFSYVGGIGFRF